MRQGDEVRVVSSVAALRQEWSRFSRDEYSSQHDRYCGKTGVVLYSHPSRALTVEFNCFDGVHERIKFPPSALTLVGEQHLVESPRKKTSTPEVVPEVVTQEVPQGEATRAYMPCVWEEEEREMSEELRREQEERDFLAGQSADAEAEENARREQEEREFLEMEERRQEQEERDFLAGQSADAEAEENARREQEERELLEMEERRREAEEWIFLKAEECRQEEAAAAELLEIAHCTLALPSEETTSPNSLKAFGPKTGMVVKSPMQPVRELLRMFESQVESRAVRDNERQLRGIGRLL